MSSCGEVPGVELITGRLLLSLHIHHSLCKAESQTNTFVFLIFCSSVVVLLLLSSLLLLLSLLLFDVESLKLYFRRSMHKPYRPNYTQTPVSVAIVLLRKVIIANF